MIEVPLNYVDEATGRVFRVIDSRYDPSAAPPGGGGGSTSVSSTGDIRGMGFHVPPDSLSNLTAALATHTTTRTEIAYFGDSTGFGSGEYLGGPVRKIRARMLAAGITDGGRGSVLGGDDNPSAWGGDYIPLYAEKNGFDMMPAGYDYPPGGGLVSETVGDTVTFQGYCSAVRLQHLRYGGSATFTYEVDGGAPVAVAPAVGSPNLTKDTIYIGGLVYGLHEIKITVTGAGRCNITPEFIRDTGLVIHRDAVSGLQSFQWFNAESANKGSNVGNNTSGQLALGLNPVTLDGTDWQNATPGPRPKYRTVKAAVFALGLNDQSNVAAGDYEEGGDREASVLQENFCHFIRLTRAAGADPILAIPHLNFDHRAATIGGRYQTALVTAAEAHSVAWVDYNIALQQGNYQGWGAHIDQVGYDMEGDFMFDHCLKYALPDPA